MSPNTPMPSEKYFVARPRMMHLLREALVERRERGLVLIGSGGSGKTSLVSHFTNQHYRAFEGGISQTAGHLFDPAEPTTITNFIGGGSGLHIFDGLDEVTKPEAVYAAILAGLAANPRAQALITSRAAAGAELPHLALGPMSEAETGMLLHRILLSADPPPSEALELIAGHPLTAELFGDLVRQRGSYSDVLRELRSFQQSGLIGLDGRPLSDEGTRARRIVTNVRDVNAELLALLQRDPDRVFGLSPRQFEEVTATLFERLGFTVTLTPPSKDGGKDLYIAKTDALGSFLYYVECKRYAPNRPVGVGLVNALTGVVESGRATAGILLTTSRFTSGAKTVQERWQYRLSLKDFSDFKQMLKDAGRPN